MFRPITSIAGNLRDFPLGSRAVERIAVSSSAMTRRILRLSSSAGELGLTLERDTRLRDGDILVADSDRVIAVEVLPDDVLIAYPGSIAEAIETAHALGNRHVPILRDGDAIIIGYADALQSLLAKIGVRFERTARVLEQPFVHASAPHSHA